jgi:hypothetical protein
LPTHIYNTKKEGLSHGLAISEDNDKNDKKSSSEQATQDYKLFDEGKKPIEVAIELGLREGQVNKFFREFWKLKRQYRLYEIYPQIEPCLASFLKLYKTLNVEWFVDLIELCVVKLPELQGQYQLLQDKVKGLQHNFQDIQYRMQESERHLQYNQQRIIEQTDALNASTDF